MIAMNKKIDFGKYVNTAQLCDRSDEELMGRYQQTRASDLFEELARRYRQPLYNHLRRYLGDHELAEETLQLTLLNLHTKCGQFDPKKRLQPWLYRIATNRAIDCLRGRRRHQLVSLDADLSDNDGEISRWSESLAAANEDPIDRLGRQENSIRLHEAVADLPEQLRRIVSLVHFQGMKYREAAEELAIPVGTLKSRMHKAHRKLQYAYTANGGSMP